MDKAVIFNIQRYSIQDGPGIRTSVFFKGCPLRCQWCSNPEGQSTKIELAHNSVLCNGCGKCLEVCSKKAIKISDHKVAVNRQTCDSCGKCVEVCYAGVFKFLGENLTIETVIKEVMADAAYYHKSGGGITVSGGESLVQADFVAELLRQCQEKGVHTCINTCGSAPLPQLEKVMKYLDLVYYDLKHMDSRVHKVLTGQGNELILANLKAIIKRGIPTAIRIPLIPGANDSEENLSKTAEFVRELGGSIFEIDVLPYHRYGVGKYAGLDMDYLLGEVASLSPESPEVMKAKQILEISGITVRIEV